MKLLLVSLASLALVSIVVFVLLFLFPDEKPKWKKQMDDPTHWEKQLADARKAAAEAEGHLLRLRPTTK